MSRQFVIIPSKAFFDRELSPLDIKVLGAFSVHTDGFGLSWPAVDTIAHLVGSGVEAVRASIKALEDRGYIETIENNTGYQGQYRTILDRDEVGNVVRGDVK